MKERQRQTEKEHKGVRSREGGRERIPSMLHIARGEPHTGFKLRNHQILT